MVAVALDWLEPDSPLKYLSTRTLMPGDLRREQKLALAEACEMISALDAGEDYLAGRRNEFWCGRYSPADGSAQPFVAIVPTDFDAGKTYPLLVSLHGSGWIARPHRDIVHTGDYIEVWPCARGNAYYEALAEQDVLGVIRYMQRWYRIDPKRIIIRGRSMGGGGTWRIASRRPDLFAAAAPYFGWPVGAPIENLRNVPIFNQHGLKDWSFVELGRFGVNRLQKLGYTVANKEFPGVGHEFDKMTYPVIDWMLKRRLIERPVAITYTCETPEQGRAYWLRVRGLGDPHLPARVKARVNGRGKFQTLTLLARNVDVLELDLTKMPVERDAELLIQAGGDFLTAGAPLPDRLFLLRKPQGWTLAAEPTEPGSDVRPYRPGAAADLYTGEPLLIVCGSQANAERTALLKEAAESIAGYPGGGSWQSPDVFAQFPVKADREVTPVDLERYNIILLGSARDNSLIARITDKLPFTINDKNELVTGGREPVSLDGAGIRLAYYNPLVPERLIFLIATDESGEKAEKWFKDARRLLTGSDGNNRVDQPDLVVQSLDGPDRRLMQFTHGWKWRKVEGADRRIPEVMAGAKQMALARLRVMRRTAGGCGIIISVRMRDRSARPGVRR